MALSPLPAGKKLLGWISIIALIVAGTAGAVHMCELGVGQRAGVHSAYGSADTSHVFCTICAFVHSPSLTGLQFSITPLFDFSINTIAPTITHEALVHRFALSVRAPPAR
jgi:hypothetical protein